MALTIKSGLFRAKAANQKNPGQNLIFWVGSKFDQFFKSRLPVARTFAQKIKWDLTVGRKMCPKPGRTEPANRANLNHRYQISYSFLKLTKPNNFC